MENRNTQRIYKMIMLVLIVIIVTSLVTAFTTYQYLSNNGISYSKVNTTSLEGLEYTLSQFRSELEKKYIGEINDEELIEGAVKGYVDALGDPYTTYYTKKEMKTIMEETNGNFVGIGVYMTKDLEKNAILIIKPIENSPAEKAGILPGDLITKVDDVEYTGDKLEEASNKIRGEEGTKVKLEIYRNGETKTFELTRTKVVVSHVTTKVLNNDIGYIAISDFEGECASEFETKYKQLEKQGIKKLIIDIRNNGGGIVDEALKIANMLVDKDSTLLITKDKSDKEEVTKATEKPIINIPTVVLVNEYSASASEILAGALKDNGKATLVGTKTYGKGIIQELHQLSDGSGLKITVSEYYTPNHNAIHKIGITPDVEVDLSEDVKQQTTIQEKDDNQLQKAIEILK
ncbi:carboxyl-terminal protease [Clostridium sp. CAG:508]|jgi:carboxyl-terminal processing protease|nr:carboxyl-terminal protease [Clostridium sp. CAG:508]